MIRAEVELSDLGAGDPAQPSGSQAHIAAVVARYDRPDSGSSHSTDDAAGDGSPYRPARHTANDGSRPGANEGSGADVAIKHRVRTPRQQKRGDRHHHDLGHSLSPSRKRIA